ncbi:Sialic acid-binding Ig-like lectin 5 [Galemys pyrenaicus]|uniref:Sialic acid-binding Ig-like lectin 5 n=1 Tax=Galemys pyrenaicus TaxID=202257 RepID=A0A8J6DTL7_GALPY|nr:Sialic acid-binding Ig-like lectin 5 [Galemys pyrenaicus]
MLLLLLLLLLLPLVWAGSLKATARHELHVQAPTSVTVQEGLCVLVPCTFSSPRGGQGPTHGSWFKSGSPDVLVATNYLGKKRNRNTNPSFHLGDPAANNCTLAITSPQKEDSGEYYFCMDRGKNRTHCGRHMLTVLVRELTQAPNIEVEASLQAGRPSLLTCSLPGACAGLVPPTISWTGAALRPGSAWHDSAELQLTPRPRDHGTHLTCRVSLCRPGVSTERTLTLNVTYAPQNLTVGLLRGDYAELRGLANGSSLPVLEGESLRLLCAADSNPPARLSWAWGSGAPATPRPSNTGVLVLPHVEFRHEGEFTCHAQHPLGSQRVSLHLSVQSPLQLLGPSCSPEDEDADGGLLCSCSARARPAPALRWRLGEQLLEGSRSNGSVEVTLDPWGLWANSSLRLGGRALSSALTLSCEARNAREARSAALLLLPRRAGKPALGKEFVLGAVLGAGAVGLLALFSGFICFL